MILRKIRPKIGSSLIKESKFLRYVHILYLQNIIYATAIHDIHAKFVDRIFVNLFLVLGENKLMAI